MLSNKETQGQPEIMFPLTGKRIFYIEDDLMNRAVVKTILEYAGAVFASEFWGHMEVVQSRLRCFLPIDLILLDLMFPKNVSGYDIFDALHRQALFSQIPIVAVSASEPAVEVPKTRAKGFRGFIPKPINLYTFPEQIVTMLEQEQFVCLRRIAKITCHCGRDKRSLLA